MYISLSVMKASKFSIVWGMNGNSDVFNKSYEINLIFTERKIIPF